MFQKEKNKLIHNWINTETLNNNDRFFDGKIFKILWIGRILPWKGLDILIEIARELKFNDLVILKLIFMVITQKRIINICL